PGQRQAGPGGRQTHRRAAGAGAAARGVRKPLTPQPPLPRRGEGEPDLLLPPPPFVGEGGRGGEGEPLRICHVHHSGECRRSAARLEAAGPAALSALRGPGAWGRAAGAPPRRRLPALAGRRRASSSPCSAAPATSTSGT